MVGEMGLVLTQMGTMTGNTAKIGVEEGIKRMERIEKKRTGRRKIPMAGSPDADLVNQSYSRRAASILYTGTLMIHGQTPAYRQLETELFG